MPSVTALRAILGASLGLGAIDVLWLDLALAPRIVADDAPPPAVAAPAPAVVAAEPPIAEAPAAPAPAPIEAPTTDHVYFATRTADLDAAARTTLDRLAAAGGTFVLEGHADLRGSEQINERLSKERADAVADYLAEHGVERTHIEVRFAGESRAVHGDELWRDRRVDIQITGGAR